MTEATKSWQYRAIEFCHGNQSQLGAFLIAMMGRKVNPPCFHPRGVKINLEGNVLALYRGTAKDKWRVEFVYHVSELVSLFRGLAEKLELSDAERVAMFDELRKFIFKDERAVSVC